LGALPSFGPVLEWEQAAVPHIVVLADRVGADLAALTRAGDEWVTSVGPGDGHDPELRRSAPGGWSQRRYQQRAENLWEERAKEVAQDLAGLAEKIGARLIVVAGDVRAVQLLEEALPEGVREIVRNVEGSRAADGGLDALAEETVRLAATVAAEDTVACLGRLEEELGREGGLAVEGVEDTLAALAEARVDVLLVHDDPDDDRQAFFGPKANLVATGPDPLIDLAVEKPTSARLVDVAIRSALGTGAGVRIVPNVPRDGMAGFMRY
jgi:peptide subunit release factor 1 (eRF1)